MRGAIFVAAFLTAASSAQARGYNCAVPDDRPEGRWPMDQALSMQIIGDIGAQHFGAPLHFRYRFCGSIENGQQVVMVGMIAIKEGQPQCDAPENFAIFYDPKNRTFGKPIPEQTFCFPPDPTPAP